MYLKISLLLSLILIFSCSVSFAAVEDFTTYTETDSAGDITVNSGTLITIDTMRRDANSSVTDDKGAGHFGNFEHLIQSNPTANDGNINDVAVCWALANVAHTTVQNLVDAGSGFFLNWQTGLTPPRLSFEKRDGGAQGDLSIQLSFATEYYMTIERTGSTLTCKIYDDSIRTNLLDTLSLTHNATTFRYVGVVGSRESGSFPDDNFSFTVQNLDLQEAVGWSHLINGISPAKVNTVALADIATINSK